MSGEEEKKILPEDFEELDPLLKNFHPAPSKPVDPMAKPPKGLGGPVGAKPDAGGSSGESAEPGAGDSKDKE